MILSETRKAQELTTIAQAKMLEFIFNSSARKMKIR